MYWTTNLQMCDNVNMQKTKAREMNRREANRIAKHLYTGHGENFLILEHEALVEYFEIAGDTYNDCEIAMIRDYYERTCKRVADWLGV